MENMDIEWLPLKGIPTNVTISTIFEHNNSMYAGGTEMSDTTDSHAVIYVSDDNGTTWKEWIKITDELSSLSSMFIKDNTLIVAGRKGQLQQEWQGGIYKVTL